MIGKASAALVLAAFSGPVVAQFDAERHLLEQTSSASAEQAISSTYKEGERFGDWYVALLSDKMDATPIVGVVTVAAVLDRNDNPSGRFNSFGLLIIGKNLISIESDANGRNFWPYCEFDTGSISVDGARPIELTDLTEDGQCQLVNSNGATIRRMKAGSDATVRLLNRNMSISGNYPLAIRRTFAYIMCMSTKPQTIAQFFKRFPNEETCLQNLFDVRFGQGHVCPKCSRASKWFKIKAERAFSCQWCGHHLHPTVGTPFEKTRTPLQLWYYAIFLFTTTRNGVAAKELERQLGVTYKTAWRMAGLIREHMAEVDGDARIGGFGRTVEIDETYIGGYEANAKGGKNKAVVLGMKERGGDVVTAVVKDRRSGTLLPHVVKHVMPYSEIHTDEWVGYGGLGSMNRYHHKSVNHNAGEYVSYRPGNVGATVNGIEGFWAQLKRSISGTHIHVSPKHLWKYAKEAEYRFNRRYRPETMLDELLTTFRPSSEQRG